MKLYWLTLGSLAVWRITHLLTSEDGPREIFVRFRRLAGEGFWGNLLDCFYCLSLWIAAPIAWWLGDSWKEALLLWPALSAASIAIERIAPREKPEAALYFEEPEVQQSVLLRKEERDRPNASPAGAPSRNRL